MNCMDQNRLKAFAKDRRGNVAMTLAIAAVPLFATVGGAVDFHRASRDAAELQGVFDAAALAGVRQAALGEAVVKQTAQRHIDGHLAGHLKSYPVAIETSDGGKTLRIRTDGATMPTSILGVIGMPTLNVVAKSAATSTTFHTVTSAKPIMAELDPEAGDYNRMYVYCFDKSRQNHADFGRSQMTAIADNAGTKYNFNMPACKEGDTISYRLYNVRNARTKPHLWDNATPGTLIPNNPADWASPWSNNLSYNYYSDTTLTAGVPTHNFTNAVPILETVICDNLGQCKGKGKGGIIPEGKNRTPQQAAKACEPGKFMYFGWEDRPPGYGWTDGDYDDIRVIVECPKVSSTATTVVRLIE
jgi:Flp pilus assembly protein TadG